MVSLRFLESIQIPSTYEFAISEDFLYLTLQRPKDDGISIEEIGKALGRRVIAIKGHHSGMSTPFIRYGPCHIIEQDTLYSIEGTHISKSTHKNELTDLCEDIFQVYSDGNKLYVVGDEEYLILNMDHSLAFALNGGPDRFFRDPAYLNNGLVFPIGFDRPEWEVYKNGKRTAVKSIPGDICESQLNFFDILEKGGDPTTGNYFSCTFSDGENIYFNTSLEDIFSLDDETLLLRGERDAHYCYHHANNGENAVLIGKNKVWLLSDREIKGSGCMRDKDGIVRLANTRTDDIFQIDYDGAHVCILRVDDTKLDVYTIQ